MSDVSWDNAPVILVLADVRFDTVSKMASYVDEIQDAMRKSGYPKFERKEARKINLDLSSQQHISEISYFWEFANKANTESFILSNDSLIFKTADYQHFESFKTVLKQGLDIVCRIADLAVGSCPRVGLRYVDAVQPPAGRSLSEYIKPGLLGFDFDDLAMERKGGLSESYADTERGRLVVKCWQGSGVGVPLPPDLASPPILDLKPLVDISKHHALLDFDNIHFDSIDFSISGVMGVLDDLHADTSRAFLAASTPEAILDWSTGAS